MSTSHLSALSTSPLRPSIEPILDEAPITRDTLLPAANGLMTTELIAIVFPSLDILQAAVTLPTHIDCHVADKVVEKLAPFIGKHLYPSQIAHHIFELAFVDAALSPKQRTDNIGYVFSNLGSGNAYVIEKLFAFYYGYSFEYFASKKE
jgi:hypothetical protein